MERNRKTNEFIHAQSDGLITWVVGFAFSGLLLLVANLKNFGGRNPTKPVLVCLLLTIGLGIAFRYTSFLVMLFEKGLDDYYSGLFSETGMMAIGQDKDLHALNFEEVHVLLKEDFDETITYPLPVTEELKQAELPRLKAHYNHLVEHSRRSLAIAIQHLAEVEETTHRIPVDVTLALFEKGLKKTNVGYNARRWTRMRSLLFILCLLAFVTAVFILGLSVLFTKDAY